MPPTCTQVRVDSIIWRPYAVVVELMARQGILPTVAPAGWMQKPNRRIQEAGRQRQANGGAAMHLVSILTEVPQHHNNNTTTTHNMPY